MICLKNRTLAVSQTTYTSIVLLPRRLWFAWKIVLLQYRKQQVIGWCLWRWVVICLKNRTFAVSQTTAAICIRQATLLWFAWKIVLLQYRKQPHPKTSYVGLRCDLLEKSYFCSIANNSNQILRLLMELWFAWKIVLLQYRKQPNRGLGRKFVSCDLLEKSYFCSIANNILYICGRWNCVVICLKNRTFAVSQTTDFP